jgi:4-amino-4-deoxy-L-arabinose transferase-like glycosyltransferase
MTGMLVLALPSRGPGAVSEVFPWGWEITGLGLILLAGIFLRVWRLHDFPPACWHDEAENGLETLRILKGDWFVFTPNNNGRGGWQFFWTAPFFRWWGVSVYALRLASACAGVLTIPAVWLLFRRLAQPRLALLGAGFLGVSFWHVAISRLGFDAVWTPLFDVLMVWAVWEACRKNTWFWAALAGFFAGWGNYGYAASRLSPLLMVVAFWILGGPRRLSKMALALVVCGMVLIPLFQSAWTQPKAFAQRTQQVSVLRKVVQEHTLRPLLRTIRSTLRMLHERGDANPRHNLSGRPMLDVITGLLLLAGLASAWRSRWEKADQLMLAWLGMSLFFGGALTEPAPHALRTLSALIPVCFLAARGAESLLKKRPALATLAGAGLLLLVAGITCQAYFQAYPESPGLRTAFSSQAFEVGQYLARNPAYGRAFISDAISGSVVKFTAVKDSDTIIFENPVRMQPEPGAVYIFNNPTEIPACLRTPAFHQTLGPAGAEPFVVVKEENHDRW